MEVAVEQEAETGPGGDGGGGGGSGSGSGTLHGACVGGVGGAGACGGGPRQPGREHTAPTPGAQRPLTTRTPCRRVPAPWWLLAQHVACLPPAAQRGRRAAAGRDEIFHAARTRCAHGAHTLLPLSPLTALHAMLRFNSNDSQQQGSDAVSPPRRWGAEQLGTRAGREAAAAGSEQGAGSCMSLYYMGQNEKKKKVLVAEHGLGVVLCCVDGLARHDTAWHGMDWGDCFVWPGTAWVGRTVCPDGCPSHLRRFDTSRQVGTGGTQKTRKPKKKRDKKEKGQRWWWVQRETPRTQSKGRSTDDPKCRLPPPSPAHPSLKLQGS